MKVQGFSGSGKERVRGLLPTLHAELSGSTVWNRLASKRSGKESTLQGQLALARVRPLPGVLRVQRGKGGLWYGSQEGTKDIA